MPLASSLRAYADLVAIEAGGAALLKNAVGGGVAKVKQTLYEMGYRITAAAPNLYSPVFDQELEDAIRKFAATQPRFVPGLAGAIDKPFLTALDAILLGGDFDIPDYGATPAPAGGALTPLQAGVAQIAEIGRNIANAMAVLAGAYGALTAAPGSPLAGGYPLVAGAFDLNFALDRLADDRARAEAIRKIATVLAKASAYMANAANFLYAPPALVTRHGVTPGAYAYYRPTDDKVYFTDLYLRLRPAGRWRATTHELMHAAGIDHGTNAPRPPYWWNLDAYNWLTPTERLNNADNYVWFIDYCQPPFGRKQPKP